MKFTVIWTCDDEFCREPLGPSEIEADTEQEAVKQVEKIRADREFLGISVVPCQLKYEKVLWGKPVLKS